MADAIVFTLPEVPDPDRLEAHWWLVADGQIVESGIGTEWTGLAAAIGDDRKRVALAPAAAVRIDFAARPPASSDRQAVSGARVEAVEASLGDSEALHSVSVLCGATVMTAVVDNGTMLAWLDWAGEAGADPNHVVPAGLLLPLGEDWTAATFGPERVIGRAGTVMPFEPELASRIVGDSEPRELGAEEVEAAIAAAAHEPPLDLRSGKMARRRRIVIDRQRIRHLAILAAIIPLLSLIVMIISIFKLNSATERLNERSLAVAENALGRPVELESAESELSQRVGGAGYGGVMAPLSGLYSALQAEQRVSTTDLSYSSDGTLSATLAAPTIDSVNRVLVALQRNGYKITAVPRQAADGRSMVDVTVRSGL